MTNTWCLSSATHLEVVWDVLGRLEEEDELTVSSQRHCMGQSSPASIRSVNCGGWEKASYKGSEYHHWNVINTPSTSQRSRQSPGQTRPHYTRLWLQGLSWSPTGHRRGSLLPMQVDRAYSLRVPFPPCSSTEWMRLAGTSGDHMLKQVTHSGLPRAMSRWVLSISKDCDSNNPTSTINLRQCLTTLTEAMSEQHVLCSSLCPSPPVLSLGTTQKTLAPFSLFFSQFFIIYTKHHQVFAKIPPSLPISSPGRAGPWWDWKHSVSKTGTDGPGWTDGVGWIWTWCGPFEVMAGECWLSTEDRNSRG